MQTATLLTQIKYMINHLCSCGSDVQHGYEIQFVDLITAWQSLDNDDDTHDFGLNSTCYDCNMLLTSSLITKKEIRDEVKSMLDGNVTLTDAILNAELYEEADELVMKAFEKLVKYYKGTIVWIVAHTAFYDINDKGDVESTEGLISLHSTEEAANIASKEWDDSWDQDNLNETEGHSYVRMEVIY